MQVLHPTQRERWNSIFSLPQLCVYNFPKSKTVNGDGAVLIFKTDSQKF